MRGWLIAALLSCACGADSASIEIIIDTPDPASDAYPYGGLDALILSVAGEGDLLDLQVVTVDADKSPGLSGIAFGSDLVVHLSGRAGNIESAYGRTCAFDVLAGDAGTEETHLYFSRILKWAAAPTPVEPTRASGAGYSLLDGRAVFLGGGMDVERFDPLETGEFSAVDGAQPRARENGVVAPLPDGRALIIGGDVVGGSGPVSEIEVLDPRVEPGPAGRVETLQDGLALRDHRAVTLVDGTVLVVGGLFRPTPEDSFALTDQVWLLEFGEAGQLEAPNELSAKLGIARADFSMTRLGDDTGAPVLIAGGKDEEGRAIGQAELYRPLRDDFDEAFRESGLGLMGVPRYGHTAVPLVGGFVLIIGGFRTIGMTGIEPVKELEVFDPILGTFEVVGDLLSGAGFSNFATTPLPDGRILITGGLDGDDQPVSTALIAALDSVNGAIDLFRAEPMQVPRAGHSAVQLCDGTILIVGGTSDSSIGAERYNPSSTDRR